MLTCNPLPKLSCVYKIVNVDNPTKFYIGSTNNLRERIQGHIRELKNNKHHSIKLQRAVNKYGIDKFNVHIIEFAKGDRNKLYEQEQTLIDLFEPFYNCSTQVHIGKFSLDNSIKVNESKRGVFKNSNSGIANISYINKDQAYSVLIFRNGTKYLLCSTKDLEKAKEIADKYRFASQEEIEKYVTIKKLNKKSRYSYIYYRKTYNHYRCCIRLKGITIEIGTFKNELDAVRAYNNYITINFINKQLHII